MQSQSSCMLQMFVQFLRQHLLYCSNSFHCHVTENISPIKKQDIEERFWDLFNGGKLSMENKKEELEKELLQMLKKKEEADKRLLSLEVVLGITMVIIFFTLAMIASLVTMDDWLRIVLILIGAVPLFIVSFVLLRIEQVAGYYECQECKHRYVPTYKAITLAQHLGRTRKMTCPKCGKKSWQKKVVSKTED